MTNADAVCSKCALVMTLAAVSGNSFVNPLQTAWQHRGHLRPPDDQQSEKPLVVLADGKDGCSEFFFQCSLPDTLQEEEFLPWSEEVDLAIPRDLVSSSA